MNLSQNTTLTDLRCRGNQLNNIDVSQNTNLEELDCGYMELSDLDVSQNANLESLSCSGNQIDNFTRSVFFRLREIKHKEPFPSEKELYPGNYIIDIANKILKKTPKINLNNFKKIYKTLKNESLKHSMNLIKDDLKQLGIKHDRFFSETKIVNNNLVYKTVNKLKKNKFIEEGFLDPPKGEDSHGWKKTKRLIFKSTLFGDDTDRALQKNDGSWTYFHCLRSAHWHDYPADYPAVRLH